MDDAGPQSLFVVVEYDRGAPYFSSIIQLDTQVNNNHEYAAPEQIKKLQVNQKDYVARFGEPPRCPLIRWLFSPPTSSTEDLYMVPDWGHKEDILREPLHGCKFNFRTGECRPIKPPRAAKAYGDVVNRRGHIYFMAHPDLYYDTPDPVFECYDPDKNKWKALEPFPDHAIHLRRCSIEATAVWDDTILYNMGSCKFWAYNVPKDKWYIVHVDDDRCYSIEGEAVVLENTIYALTDPCYSCELVLALSIEREEIDGDLVFKCSLRSEILVPGMEQIKYKYKDDHTRSRTRHLVHLGKDDFCLVQSCSFYNMYGLNRYQPIQLTSIKRKGEDSMTVTNICLYEVEIQRDKQFEVRICFSLPECKTTALKEGERFVFNLEPMSGDYASKQKDKTDFNPETEVGKPVQASTLGVGSASEKSNTDEEGHSIYVRNLPPDATFRQLEKELKKFGSIKRDGIRVLINNTGKCFAYVEFESATSKQRAIEASTIIIRGCRAEIEEKRRRRGLTLVDSSRTSGSSSFGLKNHGKVSRSKTTCVGHNVGEDGGYQPPCRPKGVWKNLCSNEYL